MDEITSAGDSQSTDYVEKHIVEDEAIEASSDLLESPATESDKLDNPISENKAIKAVLDRDIELEPDPPDICKPTLTQQNKDPDLSIEEPMEVDQSAQELEKGIHESTGIDKDINIASQVDVDLEKLAELKLISTNPHEEPAKENLNSAVENASEEATLSSNSNNPSPSQKNTENDKQDIEVLSELIVSDGRDATDENTESATEENTGTATKGNTGTAIERNTGTAIEGTTETTREGNTGTTTELNTGTATEGNTGIAIEETTETTREGNTGTATELNIGTATEGNTGTSTEGTTETTREGNTGTATEGSIETATEGNTETATEGTTETAREGNTETATEGSTETATEGTTETTREGNTATEGSTETATEGSTETATEGSTETATEENTDTEMSCNNIEVCDDSSQSNSNKDTTIEDEGENTTTPIFMDIDKNKDDNDKATTGTDQDDDVDPIGESGSEWSSQTTTETDDAECIIPDNNRALTQEERDSASNTEETADSSGAIPSTSQDDPEINNDLKGKYLVKSCDEVGLKNCMHCSKDAVAKYTVTVDRAEKFLCSESCLKSLTDKNPDDVLMHEMPAENSASQAATSAKPSGEEELRSCAECNTTLTEPEASLSWESLEFCDTKCILKYQKRIGSFCVSCDKDVREHFLGKYCVRFGFKIRQFCSSVCLVKYKRGLKVCSYCQEDIAENSSGFVANIEKGQFRDFCAVSCLENYKALKKVEKANGSCAVCHKVKPIEIEYSSPTSIDKFCSEPCFVAFKYVNNVQPEKCATCSRYYGTKFLQLHVVCTDGVIKRFCTKICQIVYINMHRKIVSCGWCKVKKYNFDMIQKSVEGRIILMCSIPCLRLFEVTPKSKNKPVCNNCFEPCRVTYHIANDGGMKNFCTYQCVQDFQSKQNPTVRVADVQTVVPTIVKRITRKNVSVNTRKQIIPDVPGPLPIITSVRSLAPTANPETRNTRSKAVSPVTVEPPEPPVKHILFVRPPDLPDIRNISTMVKPLTVEQETHITPDYADKETQTDRFNGMDIEIIPIPIYVPQPVHMYSLPYFKPSPFPLPVPVPILMPLTKGAANGILKEVKTAQPTPSDPYEADLLVMAQLVADADDNKETPEEPIVESDPDDVPADDPPYSPEPQEPTPPFGDDMLQMALNIATSFTEPAVDLEGALTASTITATASTVEQTEIVPPPRMLPERSAARGRKRGRPARGSRGRGRGRSSVQPESPAVSAPIQETPQEPTEKPDANMCLKYTFGVNAWKQWVTNKNNDMEKTTRRPKPFKTDLLQLTSDELNYSLCLFVKEVRKPNGAEYAPDTIYYLCLGIQQYLFENGRIDNIFCDPYYETFTDCLDEICKKFSTLYNDSQYIVTRVEEEHLWESKQLGAHSPHVLLTTLMFFNTKHFNLTNVEEHMQLSFSHIMKHWKRMPSTPGGTKSLSSRNILLRFYPPQSAVEGKSKKKVYEQQENEENPIRCPVKLYEFYLSKCPESVKTRNDVFYLQPERSCVPDSPVWYSTMALATDALEKMLHRVKMVKEINVALLAS